MTYYYAFCTVHKKVGEKTEDRNQAWTDARNHIDNVPGPHGDVYVKKCWIGTNGKWNYRNIKTP